MSNNTIISFKIIVLSLVVLSSLTLLSAQPLHKQQIHNNAIYSLDKIDANNKGLVAFSKHDLSGSLIWRCILEQGIEVVDFASNGEGHFLLVGKTSSSDKDDRSLLYSLYDDGKQYRYAYAIGQDYGDRESYKSIIYKKSVGNYTLLSEFDTPDGNTQIQLLSVEVDGKITLLGNYGNYLSSKGLLADIGNKWTILGSTINTNKASYITTNSDFSILETFEVDDLNGESSIYDATLNIEDKIIVGVTSKDTGFFSQIGEGGKVKWAYELPQASYLYEIRPQRSSGGQSGVRNSYHLLGVPKNNADKYSILYHIAIEQPFSQTTNNSDATQVQLLSCKYVNLNTVSNEKAVTSSVGSQLFDTNVTDSLHINRDITLEDCSDMNQAPIIPYDLKLKAKIVEQKHLTNARTTRVIPQSILDNSQQRNNRLLHKSDSNEEQTDEGDYAVLQYKRTTDAHRFSDKLRFVYDEKYNNTKLKYKIYNNRGQIISSSDDTLITVRYGRNYIEIPLGVNLSGKKPTAASLLEVTNAKNQKLYLKFDYVPNGVNL